MGAGGLGAFGRGSREGPWDLKVSEVFWHIKKSGISFPLARADRLLRRQIGRRRVFYFTSDCGGQIYGYIFVEDIK